MSTYFNPGIAAKEPKKTLAQEMKDFHEAEYFAMLGHAISGGIESPLQFGLQVLKITVSNLTFKSYNLLRQARQNNSQP